jgi:hypothetical protein
MCTIDTNTPITSKNDQRCKTLIDCGRLWRVATKKESLKAAYYDKVLRPCFVHRLIKAAQQKNRASRQPSDERQLKKNWSHDMVIAQYARAAAILGRNTELVRDVRKSMPHVWDSMEKRRGQTSAPRGTQQLKNRSSKFADAVHEAEASKETYDRIKRIAEMMKFM